MPNRIEGVYVKAPSRLHFGLIELRGDIGRIFGSVGVALCTPSLWIKASRYERVEVVGDDERAASFAKLFLDHYHIKGGCKVEVKSSIPAHVGLGSGTQTALAVAKALSLLYDVNVSLNELAVVMKRVSVSGIGLRAFERGGFIVDGGYKVDKGGRAKVERGSPPPVIFNHPFPDDWYFVVAIPRIRRGLSGDDEKKAFDQLPEPSEEVVSRMYRVLYGSMIPSLIEKDIATFGKALTELQVLTGKCCEPIQGGIYSSPEIEACVNFFLEIGAYGAGQSSWGPTSYGLAERKEQALRLLSSIKAFLHRSYGGDAFLTKVRNRGASIRRILT